MTTKPVKDDSLFDFDVEVGTIFKGVVFQLDPNLPTSEQSKLKNQLLNRGATWYDEKNNEKSIERPTHYITDRDTIAKDTAAKESTAIASHIVTSLWVKTAIRNGFVHEPQYYTPDPSRFFSGIVVATSGIPLSDQEAIFGATAALGGQYREDLAIDLTHLVCLAPEGDMYDEAMGPLFGKIKVILPHWFSECFKLRRLIPETAFLFPDPPFLQQQGTSSLLDGSNLSSVVSSLNKQLTGTKNQHGTEQQDTDLSRSDTMKSTPTTETDTVTDAKLKNNNKTNIEKNSPIHDGPMVYCIPNIEVLKTLVPKEQYFDGKLIYIHSDVGLPPEVHTCLTQHLETAGAKMTNNYDDIKGHDAVIAIFKYRNSDQYWEVCKQPEVMVANLAWITNTLRRGHVESPLRSIFDYPIPYGGIIGMQNLVATISGYEGEARNLLFRICGMVGLPCSSELNLTTTLLICSKRGTAKFKTGKSRNCDVVNHLWLEECFQQWTLKSVADERYTYFPSNNILQTLVGKTPLTTDNLKPWFDKDTCPPVAPYVPIHLLHRSPGLNSPSNGTDLARRPRQAALDANSQLRDVYVPDLNKYQIEQRSSNNNTHHSPALSPLPPATATTSSTKPSTENTGKQRRRSSASLPSPSSSPAPVPKRPKLDNMKSKSASASSKQATQLPSSSSSSKPSKSPSKSKSSSKLAAPTNQSASSTQGSSEGSSKDGDESLAGDADMEDVSPPTTSKSKASTSASFVFADNPSKIATTSCELTKDEVKGIRRLGGTVVDDIRKAQVLVVPDRILRTPKFLCAVNLGTTIVGYQWLKDSVTNNAWCDTSKYQVKDTAMEKSYSFKLLNSLIRAQQADGSQAKWLEGYDVCVLPSAGPVQQLKDVVETAGGKIVSVPKKRATRGSSSSQSIMADPAHNKLLALADKKDTKRNGWNDLQGVGAKICDKEMIIIGALRQELALDEFGLS